jgi:hypothetical protein
MQKKGPESKGDAKVQRPLLLGHVLRGACCKLVRFEETENVSQCLVDTRECVAYEYCL